MTDRLAMNTPPIVSPQEWESARRKLLVEEKVMTRARDALAAKRRRMPGMAVQKDYRFEGPDGPASLLERVVELPRRVREDRVTALWYLSRTDAGRCPQGAGST